MKLKCLFFSLVLLISFVSAKNCLFVDIEKVNISGKASTQVYAQGNFKKTWQYGESINASDEISLFNMRAKAELKSIQVKSKSDDLFVSFRVTPGKESMPDIFAYNLEVQYQRCERIGNFVVSVQFAFGMCLNKSFDINVSCSVPNSASPYASGIMIGTTPTEANVAYLGVAVGVYGSLDNAIVLPENTNVFDLHIWCDGCEGVVYFANPALITDPQILTANTILDDWLPDLYQMQQNSRLLAPEKDVPVSLDWFGIPEKKEHPTPRRIRVESFCHATGTSLLGVRLHIPYRKDITLLWQKKCNVTVPPPPSSSSSASINQFNSTLTQEDAKKNSLFEHLKHIAELSETERRQAPLNSNVGPTALLSSFNPLASQMVPNLFGEGPLHSIVEFTKNLQAIQNESQAAPGNKASSMDKDQASGTSQNPSTNSQGFKNKDIISPIPSIKEIEANNKILEEQAAQAILTISAPVVPLEVGFDISQQKPVPIVIEPISKKAVKSFFKSLILFCFQVFVLMVIVSIFFAQVIKLSGLDPNGFMNDLYQGASLVQEKTFVVFLKASALFGSSADAIVNSPSRYAMKMQNPIGKPNNFSNDDFTFDDEEELETNSDDRFELETGVGKFSAQAGRVGYSQL
eukprot:GDKJ01019431.1.p1 GENE.GDKJ01019431.1~~GDKJ01019431.1.p1  ORF type:complete len:632 (-),score=124.25 GDKJ01019431.1:53-1948(-)